MQAIDIFPRVDGEGEVLPSDAPVLVRSAPASRAGTR